MVLASNPDYLEARLALINVELWSGKPERAEQLARLGLDRHRENTDLLAAQARALGALGRVRESVEVLDRLLVLSPGNRDARRDRDIASDGVYPWTARLEQSHEWFTSTAAPWNEYRLEVKRGTAAGPVLARFSRANRFQKNSSQAEVDWYPRIRRGTYGYMSLGYSYDAVLYPRIRAGLELYQALPWTTEVSGGYRRLGFDSPVSIYTASVSKYSGKWLCGGRLYVVPGAGRSSVSVQASVRRYLGRHGDYWGVVLGRGSSPAGVRSTTDLGVLNSNSGYFEVQKLVARHWIFGFRGGAAREDRVDFPPATRGLLDVSAAIRF
jgi:YaiO family outer membrane protein